MRGLADERTNYLSAFTYS